MPDESASDLPLLILCLPSADVVPGAETLASLAAQARILESAALAEAELAAGSVARLVVICPAPEAWIALALATEQAPSRAVENWRDSVRSLMGLLRARRRQTVLLFDQTFASDPAACAAALGVPAPDGPVARRQTDDPVLVMIARDALRGDPAAQTLAEELAATALSPSGTDSAEDHDLDVIFESYIKGLRQQASAGAAQAEAMARVVALEAAAAESRAALQAEAKATETALAAERKRAADAEAALGAKLAEAQAETGLLRDQIRLDGSVMDQMQTTLTAEQDSREAAEAGQAALAARVAALEVEVKAARTTLATERDRAAATEAEIRATLTAEQGARQTAEAEQVALGVRIQALVAEIAELRASLQAKSKAAEATLAAAHSHAAATEAALRTKLATAETEAGLLRDQIRLDGSVMDQMQAALVAERDKAADLEAKQATADAQAKSLMRAEREARAKTEADLGEMIRQLQTQVQQMGQELESYHAQVERLQAERAALMTRIAQLRDARTDLEGYYDHAKQFSDRVGVLTTDLKGLQQALQIAQAEAAEHAQHVAQLQDEIARIHRSRSYRLTTPLRKLRKTIS